MNKKQIASLIDHTLLACDADSQSIKKLCEEAKVYNFASVCVNPFYVNLAYECLKDSNVKVCTVVGFPLGCTPSENKAQEAVTAIDNGADEIDMVINVGKAKEKDFEYIKNDIQKVVNDSKLQGKKYNKDIIVKVILETCYLEAETIKNCCLCAKEAKVDFVKTSTGFAIIKNPDGTLKPNGATKEAVELMVKTVSPELKVKASGGIRTAEEAKAFISLGALRIGTSSGTKIVDSWNEEEKIKGFDY